MFDLLNTPITLDTILSVLKGLSQPNAIETIFNALGGIIDQFETDNIDIMQQAIEAHENGYLDRDDLLKIVKICANPKPTPAQLDEK
ncbi:MAG: hypothetical protein AAGA60_27010 [Cyanobacteria bacterium P01_E01_bin.42]